MKDSRGPAGPMVHLQEAVAAVRARTGMEPVAGIILGTGLGGLVEEFRIETALPYAEIPHFPLSTVESHAGLLLLGSLGGVPVVAMQGRFHLYEGYSLQAVTFPVRVMKLLGARVLMVSGACGCMNPLWKPGELVLLEDHINFLGDNPLVGPNLDELGPRFPDMSEPYDRELQALAREVAAGAGHTPPHRRLCGRPGPESGDPGRVSDAPGYGRRRGGNVHGP